MIEILQWTTKDPLNQIGYCAGVCRGADVSDIEKNIKRAKNCIKSDHGRVLEYPDVYFVMSEVSARMVRQFYTHVIGVTKLQESTRYVSGTSGFQYPSTLTESQKKELTQQYDTVMKGYNKLLENGISVEDAANILPLGMYTKVVVKMNLRALEHMAHKRLCVHALKEFREVMTQIITVLESISKEWKWICENMLIPQCDHLGYCPEQKSCGKIEGKINTMKEIGRN